MRWMGLALLVLGVAAHAQPAWTWAPPGGYVVGVGDGQTRAATRTRALEDARRLLLEAGGAHSQWTVADTERTTGSRAGVLAPTVRRQTVGFYHTQGDTRLRPLRWHEAPQGEGWTAYALVPLPGTPPLARPRHDLGAAGLSLLVPGLGQLRNGHGHGWGFLVTETLLLGGGLVLSGVAHQQAHTGPLVQPALRDRRAQQAQQTWNLAVVLWVGAGAVHLWNITDALLSPRDPWR
ncbi:MAG: hypothetical protein AB1505_33335 [Candidatus Latescibacterota bacterium]